MKYEAFHFEKSFEHGPKAAKQLNYIVFNDLIGISMTQIIFFSKQYRKSILTQLSLRKKCADFDGSVNFA